MEFDQETQQTSCQLQQSLNQDYTPGNNTRNNASQRENKSGGKSSKREPINQSDGQTAESHVPVLKPSMSCFPGWLSTGWREPSRVLGAEFPPNQVLHGLIGQRIGNHSREVRTCSRGWVLPHFIYPTSIPALSCPQFLLERKGNRGRRKSCVVLGQGGFIPLQEGAIPALTR